MCELNLVFYMHSLAGYGEASGVALCGGSLSVILLLHGRTEFMLHNAKSTRNTVS